MDIQESLNLILASKDEVGRMFYDKFLARYPELQPLFDKVNMKHQAVQLTTALMIIERYLTNPTPAVELYLQYLGTKHHDLGIARENYPKWIATMCETLSEFHGDQWSASLEAQWRQAFDRAVQAMFQGYERHITV